MHGVQSWRSEGVFVEREAIGGVVEGVGALKQGNNKLPVINQLGQSLQKGGERKANMASKTRKNPLEVTCPNPCATFCPTHICFNSTYFPPEYICPLINVFPLWPT